MTATPTATPANMQAPYRIAPDTWVISEIVEGAPGMFVPLNSMVIAGAEPVIVDTGNELSRREWLDAAFSIVDPADVRWVFLSHDDHDHIGNLVPVLEACPQATLVTTHFTVERVTRAMELPLDRMRWVNPGESFDAGDRTLVAMRPPVFDGPTTRGLFDPTTGVYWAVDTFASMVPGHLTDADDVPRELWEESMLQFGRMVSPWHAMLDATKFNAQVDAVTRLGITTVAGGHTAALHGDRLREAFDLVRRLPDLPPAELLGQIDLDEMLAAGRPERREVPVMIGLTLAQVGQFADPTTITTMAEEAERRGYAELWVLDRLLDPVSPRSSYPGTPDGAVLPPEQRLVLDPLLTLATAAARTTTIRIGTNVLVAPWYRPLLLARSLASLDVLSGGRLDIGLGLGWSADEYAGVGVPQRQLAARQEELLDALDALWGPDPVHYDGEDFAVAPAGVRPKPVQQPRPPVLLAAYTPAGLVRVGRRADGWTPAGLDIDTTAAMWSFVTNAAVEAGRDPSTLSLVVRANVWHTGRPAGADRPTYHGSIDQIASDVRGALDIGAHQVVLDLQGTTSTLAELLDLADAITDASGLRRAA